MSKKRRSADTGNQLIGVVAIIAVAIFVVGVIVIFAKSLFSGVEADVPTGLDTATVANAPAQTEAAKSDDSSSKADKKSTKKKKTDTGAETTTTTQAGLGTKTVQEYAYLRKDPSPEGEQLLCLSPGITVTVLSEEDENGYVQASFDNNGTVLSGWIHGSYLA
ncbi:MAG: SH3 domain-containing protein [Ruminococcus sp.]|nr:SH3 domain-containing protein [Ruminococcus sp.]